MAGAFGLVLPMLLIHRVRVAKRIVVSGRRSGQITVLDQSITSPLLGADTEIIEPL